MNKDVVQRRKFRRQTSLREQRAEVPQEESPPEAPAPTPAPAPQAPSFRRRKSIIMNFDDVPVTETVAEESKFSHLLPLCF